MNFVEKMDETRSSVAQITCWCIAIALHQEHGVGAKRLNRLTDKLDELQEKNTRTMTREGTRAADRERAAWIGGKVPLEFPVPVMRAPKNRKERQYRMAGNEAAGIAWQLYAAACIEVLGFGSERLRKTAGASEGQLPPSERLGRGRWDGVCADPAETLCRTGAAGRTANRRR